MNGKKLYSVGEAAKAANTTSETLRHYDRIGLVHPSQKDEWTNYRYYTEQDIVRLNTVRALQLMDLSLAEIKKVLSYDSLDEIIAFLTEAEKKADEKIEALKYGKKKIKAAKSDYIRKLKWKEESKEIKEKVMPERTILLSDTLEKPTLDNLWNYLAHFYEKVPDSLKGSFSFEDIAGIYSDENTTRLFAVCIHYIKMDGIKTLPEGKYLTAACEEEEREETRKKLMEKAEKEYGVIPSFSVELIIVSGILTWNYEVQVYIGKAGRAKPAC